jgi:hypothetical protein
MANKMVNGKQLTVMWHVDDFKISHKEDKVVTNMIDWMHIIYGDGMKVSRCKVHDYLRKTMDYSFK